MNNTSFKVWPLILPLLLVGCGNLGYYIRSARGQLDLRNQAKPIEEVLRDPEAPEGLKAKLAAALRARDFASRELGLPDNRSYRSYADLGRPYAVWDVFAAPELSLKPVEWCFAVAGCVNYRGYFSDTEAQEFAATLRSQRLDVFVAGVPAYSTLGWFDDPLLNTFMHYSEPELARLLFHELAHQIVYVADDSVFNESFATVVEVEGLRRWLRAEGSPEQAAAVEATEQRASGFHALLSRFQERLERLYASPATEEAKRESKAGIFASLKAEYRELRGSWGGYSGYDGWFAQPLNNAQIASVSIYTQLVPTLQALLAQCRGDLRRFYGTAKELATLPKPERTARLGKLSEDEAQEAGAI